jgi:hypothetical protein
MIDTHQINIRISSNLKFIEDSDLNKKIFIINFILKSYFTRKLFFIIKNIFIIFSSIKKEKVKIICFYF